MIFHFNYGYNAITDEYFYWTTGETYTSPRCYDIYRIICENGQISTEKTNIDFSTEGYFSYILFTENHVNIVTNECFKQLNLKTLAVENRVNSLFLEDNNSNGCAISFDGKLVAFGDYHTNKIQVFSTETGKLIQEIQTERLHDDYGAHILFIGDTYRIIAAAKTNIEVFDAETGKKIYKINTNGFDYYSSIMMMELLDDKKTLIIAYTGPTIACFNLETGEQNWSNSKLNETYRIGKSNDDQTIFANDDKRILKMSL